MRRERDQPMCVVMVDHDDARARRVAEVLRSAGIDVLARARSTASGLALARLRRPDLLVVGLDGPGDLIAMIRTISAEHLGGVVVVSGHASVPRLADLMTAGAKGFVHQDDLGHLPASLIGAMRGEPALSRALLGLLLEEYRTRDVKHRPVGSSVHGWDRLTNREREILEHLRRGGTTVSIARELVLEPATVRSHIASAMHKLGMASRADAVAILRSETTP